MMTKIATDKSDVTILTSDNPMNEDPCMYISHTVLQRHTKMTSNAVSGTNACTFHLPSGHLG